LGKDACGIGKVGLKVNLQRKYDDVKRMAKEDYSIINIRRRPDINDR